MSVSLCWHSLSFESETQTFHMFKIKPCLLVVFCKSLFVSSNVYGFPSTCVLNTYLFNDFFLLFLVLFFLSLNYFLTHKLKGKKSYFVQKKNMLTKGITNNIAKVCVEKSLKFNLKT